MEDKNRFWKGTWCRIGRRCNKEVCSDLETELEVNTGSLFERSKKLS
jgi:hypothetical protein